MRPSSMFSTRRQFLQNSAALFAAGAVPFADASAEAETSGQAGTSFVSDQEKRRRELWDLLGDLPWRHRPGLATLLSTEEHEGYTVERLVLDLNGIEPVPALMLIPHKRQRPHQDCCTSTGMAACTTSARSSFWRASRRNRLTRPSVPKKAWSRWRSIAGALENESTRLTEN